MRPTFHPRLINGPFDDPGLMADFLFENRAFLFDAGDLSALSPRELLRVSHVFVSHTHMDHFIGFDRILRLFLGREKVLHLFGPEGFLDCVQGKLAGYTWNLASGFDGNLTFHVTEVSPDALRTRTFACHNRFTPSEPIESCAFGGVLLREPALTVSAVILDHGSIDSLGFSLAERFHVNIKKSRLDALGLPAGPWLGAFKAALYERHPENREIIVPAKPANAPKSPAMKARRFRLGDLAPDIARITPGRKMAYVVDAAWTTANARAIIELAKDCDHLFIEAAFSGDDRPMAARKHHLTAPQAGLLAARAGARRLTVFHFSPRYTDRPDLLDAEARAVFDKGKGPVEWPALFPDAT